jgi:hypothetical protein
LGCWHFCAYIYGRRAAPILFLFLPGYSHRSCLARRSERAIAPFFFAQIGPFNKRMLQKAVSSGGATPGPTDACSAFALCCKGKAGCLGTGALRGAASSLTRATRPKAEDRAPYFEPYFVYGSRTVRNTDSKPDRAPYPKPHGSRTNHGPEGRCALL